MAKMVASLVQGYTVPWICFWSSPSIAEAASFDFWVVVLEFF